MTVPPPPTVPTGTVTHRYLGVSADGPDTDTAPDLIHLRAVTGVITPSTPRLVHTSGSAATTLECLPIQISYDASGNLQYTDPETGETQSGPLRLPANDDSVAPTVTYEVVWSIPGLGRRWSGDFTLNAGDTVDLSTVGLASAVPGSSALFVDLLKAARELEEAAAELEGVVETVETARDDTIAARDVAVPAADRAEQARDATLTAATWTLTGPGRPDQPATTGGIITGSEPVGTDYRSTDGAGAGAWVWRKRPSGWTVTDGDTGWVTLAVPSAPGLTVSSPGVVVRRIGGQVTVTVDRLSFTADYTGFNLQVPYSAGFGPDGLQSSSLLYLPGSSYSGTLRRVLASATWFRIVDVGPGENYRTLLTWPTSSQWPSTLTI